MNWILQPATDLSTAGDVACRRIKLRTLPSNNEEDKQMNSRKFGALKSILICTQNIGV